VQTVPREAAGGTSRCDLRGLRVDEALDRTASALDDAATSGANRLVIVHGLYGSGRNWGVIARRLADNRQVLTPDLRNHGDSPWTDSHGYPELAADLADMLIECFYQRLIDIGTACHLLQYEAVTTADLQCISQQLSYFFSQRAKIPRYRDDTRFGLFLLLLSFFGFTLLPYHHLGRDQCLDKAVCTTSHKSTLSSHAMNFAIDSQ
jgi:hypothetical protein